ncbi:MAG: Crp/Fnr family transcriptional regulator [Pseudomonadota bacterium]
MLKSSAWRTVFPCLANLSDEVSSILDACGQSVNVAKGTQLFGPDNPPQGMILPMSGTIRVRNGDETRPGQMLYHAGDGGRCALVAACQLTFESRSAVAIADTDVEFIFVPRKAFDRMLAVSSEFRAFLFASLSKRITDVFAVIEDTMARGIDRRLAAKLLEPRQSKHVSPTYHALSIELGTSPAVVSQLLGLFERRGWVALRGGRLGLTNQTAIRGLANESTVSMAALTDGTGTGSLHT